MDLKWTVVMEMQKRILLPEDHHYEMTTWDNKSISLYYQVSAQGMLTPEWAKQICFLVEYCWFFIGTKTKKTDL